jgi:hypothetical protein
MGRLDHRCDQAYLTLEQFPKGQSHNPFKPRGLWYGIDDSWLHWVQEEMPHWLPRYKYCYEFELDYSDILIARKISDIIPLYEDPILKKLDIEIPDWNRIKEKYKGIEYRNYSKDYRNHTAIFWDGIDCSSGVIWDTSCIKNFKRKET